MEAIIQAIQSIDAGALIAYIVSLTSIPAVAAIIGCVITFLKNRKLTKLLEDTLCSKFDNLSEKVIDTKQMSQLKHCLLTTHEENRALKKQLNELLTKIDRIDRSKD